MNKNKNRISMGHVAVINRVWLACSARAKWMEVGGVQGRARCSSPSYYSCVTKLGIVIAGNSSILCVRIIIRMIVMIMKL